MFLSVLTGGSAGLGTTWSLHPPSLYRVTLAWPGGPQISGGNCLSLSHQCSQPECQGSGCSRWAPTPSVSACLTQKICGTLQGLTNQCWRGYRCWCSDPVASCIAQLFESLLSSFSSLPWVLFTANPFFLNCLPQNLSLTDGKIEEEMCPLSILALLSPTLSSIQQLRIYWPFDCLF